MGGQACVLYGAAEFSRDADFAILADPENLSRLAAALEALQATCIAVPPFEARYLDMGLAVHFRCNHPDAEGMRIDVMSKMRGVAPFSELWERRSTFTLGDWSVEVMSLPDLVCAKKTQRDRDWPMLRRLVESHYFTNQASPSPQQVEFWLRELRTAALLAEVAVRFPDECKRVEAHRPLLSLAMGSVELLANALKEEKASIREDDRVHWEPLRRELERLRSARRPS